MTEAGRYSLAQNAVSIFLGQVGTWLITAITFAILPRYLGAHDSGVFSIGSTFGGLAATVAGLGITTLLIREVARDREKGACLVGTAIWLNIILGIGAGTIATAAGYALGYSNLTLFAIILSCIGIPFGLVGGVANAVMQGVEVMRWAAVLDVLTKLSWLVLVLVVVMFDLGVPGVLLGGLAMTVAASGLQVAVSYRFLRFSLKQFSSSSALLLTKRSMPFLMASIFFTLYTSTDVILLSRLADESAVGIYSAPMRLFGTMLFVPVTITTVIFPRLSALHATNGDKGSSLCRATLKLSVFASLTLSLAVVSFSDAALVGVLGESFKGSGPVFVLLAMSLVPTSISIVASRMIFAADRQAVVSILGACAFVAKVALGFLLIPFADARWGNPALGAAAGLVLIEIGMTVGMLRALPRGLLNADARSFFTRLGTAAIGAAVVTAFVYTVSPFAAGAAGVAVYLMLATLFGAIGPTVIVQGVRLLVSGFSLRSAPAR